MDAVDIESKEETSLWGSKTEAEGSVVGRVAPGARVSWFHLRSTMNIDS